jgi:hypothetical protein
MYKELEKRGLPDILTSRTGVRVTEENWRERRGELMDAVFEGEFGYPPDAPDYVKAELTEPDNDRFYAGKSVLRKVNLTVGLKAGAFTFPITLAWPVGRGRCPVFVHISFGKTGVHESNPTEEIIDNGFALASLYYQDICTDGPEGLSDGLSALLWKNKKRPPDGAGELAVWAWAASRVLDYLLTLDFIDPKNTAVIGHSRLGKAALLAGAVDERFAFTIPNNSGCGGAAVFRGKQGETAEKIHNRFPHWFCENFGRYSGKEEQMPYDNHFLLAALAPRRVCLGGAEQDTWAEPQSEYLSLLAAFPAYRLLGCDTSGFPEKPPVAGDIFQNEVASFHIRKGAHYLSREDWQVYMGYILGSDKTSVPL